MGGMVLNKNRNFRKFDKNIGEGVTKCKNSLAVS